MDKTIKMISEIYEKVIFYYEEDSNGTLYNKYSILRTYINSGWIYDNYAQFVELWESVKLDEDMTAYGKTVSRLVNDTDPYDNTYDDNDYDVMQGSDNNMNSSYDSFTDDQLFQMRRAMYLPDDNMSISELDTSSADVMNE